MGIVNNNPEMKKNKSALSYTTNNHYQVPTFVPDSKEFIPAPVHKQLKHSMSTLSKPVTSDSEEVMSDTSTSADSFDGKKYNKVPEFKQKHKTELCRNWEMTGTCSWGIKCAYAHGAHELVKKTNLPKYFKTRPCEAFHRDGYCSFGKRCKFMHCERDVYGDQSYITVLKENARLAH